MRLDKFLKVSRIIKRRTVANEACDMGRVKINDKISLINEIRVLNNPLLIPIRNSKAIMTR